MTNRANKEKIQRYICNTGICIISLFIIAALIWRIQCSISYYDEVLNIYISYITAALGQRHLVENGYIFSMGDLFNLPFVYLFWRITGGTEGMLLFIRFVYLGFNSMLALAFWRVFGKYYGKKTMLLFGLILITFFPGGMYTVSYDTAALFFSLMGGILLVGSEVRGNVKTCVYRYFAGVCHACMVYSYPLTAGVILLLIISVTIFHFRQDHMRGKELLCFWLPYGLGGMTVLGIFLLYVLFIGWGNIFFFQAGTLRSSLYGRAISEVAPAADGLETVISSEVPAQGTISDAESAVKSVGMTVRMAVSPLIAVIKGVGKQLYELLNYMWIQQKKTLVFTVMMLVQWGIGIVKKGRWRLFLIPEIFLVAFFAHTKITCFGGTTMYAYFFLWAPFLFFYLDDRDRRNGIIIFLILGLTSVASFLAIGFTSVRTDKAHVGLYCGAMCTFLFMVMLVKNEYISGVSLCVVVILLAAICNTGMAYIDHFQGADIKECTFRMQKGIFKGMMTWEKDVQYENLKMCLEQRNFGDGAFICMTDYNFYAACMDGNLQSTEGNFNLFYPEQRLLDGEDVQAVYGQGRWPEVIIMDRESEETYTNVINKILNKYYDMVLMETDFYLYFKKE